MKKHNFSKNILSSLITLGTIISFGYIAPSAEASSFWRDDTITITIDPGETFDYHQVDFGVGGNISFHHIDFWKTINWLTASQITIDQSIMGQIHLNPGGNFSMHGYSNAPFVDQEFPARVFCPACLSAATQSPAFYKVRLRHMAALDHVTVEVNRRCPPGGDPPGL